MSSLAMGFPKMLSVAVALFYFRISLAAPADDGYDRTTLQPLTQFRLQHRKTVCGRSLKHVVSLLVASRNTCLSLWEVMCRGICAGPTGIHGLHDGAVP